MRVTAPTSKNTSATKGRVFVGLSGGVDSSVSAALLKNDGYDVTGVFIRIVVPGYPCTAGEDKIDAMRAAAHLKIPFVEVDLSVEYKKTVFDISIGEFALGRTPNPDMLCNREIKFGIFFDWCIAQGADKVATGHYARVRDGLLYAGADTQKDQSYFLALVPQEKLKKTLFPIGHLTKPQVRALAKKVGLPNAERPDSQGLCFLGDISIGDMLHKELTLTPGEVLNEKGEVIGTHEGTAAYTLGQRHGFTIAAEVPHYVVGKDTKRNTIVVSPHKFPESVSKTQITLGESNWIGEAHDGSYLARYRYRGELIEANKVGNNITLAQARFVPEGQTLALYKGEQCIGGGIIERAWLSS